ncbi:hypothetical protein Cgig2_009604 [Carnegiea gigantea]|uniref:Uncharacterized protein n=1 Tax=Carnegiea gigantea TaxID=171969 RepID=A0A9Q1GJS9_9CARY|nr:hypothetical protein Cgig2_009604 [Carnegiea gigantea]
MASQATHITGLRIAPSMAASSSQGLAVVRVSSRSSFFGKNGTFPDGIFFPDSVGALRVSGLQLAHSHRLRRNGRSGGAFVVKMNLFDRFARVIKSYANAIISTFEDPEKILEQTVLEMNEDLTKMRQFWHLKSNWKTSTRLHNKLQKIGKLSADMKTLSVLNYLYKRAQLALSKGDEDLAREALKRRKSYADTASALRAQLDQQKNIVDTLVSNTKLLESKIQEAKSKKDTLKARAQSARTATKVNEMVGKVSTSSALAAFEKMEEKGKGASKLIVVLAMESEAEALNQLTSDELEGKFALLESSSVDDDLANLKKELSGSSKESSRQGEQRLQARKTHSKTWKSRES